MGHIRFDADGEQIDQENKHIRFDNNSDEAISSKHHIHDAKNERVSGRTHDRFDIADDREDENEDPMATSTKRARQHIRFDATVVHVTNTHPQDTSITTLSSCHEQSKRRPRYEWVQSEDEPYDAKYGPITHPEENLSSWPERATYNSYDYKRPYTVLELPKHLDLWIERHIVIEDWALLKLGQVIAFQTVELVDMQLKVSEYIIGSVEDRTDEQVDIKRMEAVPNGTG